MGRGRKISYHFYLPMEGTVTLTEAVIALKRLWMIPDVAHFLKLFFPVKTFPRSDTGL